MYNNKCFWATRISIALLLLLLLVFVLYIKGTRNFENGEINLKYAYYNVFLTYSIKYISLFFNNVLATEDWNIV